MKIITGHTGEPHIKPEQDRAVHQGLVGVGSYILNVENNLAAEVISANEIRILDGVLSHQGCFGIVETGTYDTLTIANGAQGMQRKDLIVCRYQKTGIIESMSFVVIQGTPAASNPARPAYNEGSIADGDSPVDCPLYVINLDGIAITSVDKIATEVTGVAEIIGDLTAQISALESRVDDAMTDYMVRVDVPLGACTCAPNTGTVDSYVDISSNIPAGYKAIDVHCTLTQSSDFFAWKCDFNNAARTQVNLKLQKRSGTGGTIYPWIAVICVKDI